MRTSLTFLAIVLILVSCEPKNRKKTDYKDHKATDSLTINSIKLDSTKKLVAQLPVLFDSTEFIIHPICLVHMNESKSGRSGSFSGSYDTYYDYESYNKTDDFISGNISNLVFENIKTKEQRLLTKKLIKINSVQFLRELYTKTKKPFLLYILTDSDSNNDRKWNNDDMESLYISNLDGSGFKKITNDLHEYSTGEFITATLKYYFQTIEDINHDGVFDRSDLYHHFYIDFTSASNPVVEYYPLQLIND